MTTLTTGSGARPVYLVDGLRTPYLKVRDAPGAFRASDLAVAAGRALLLRQPLRATDLDEVVFGCVASGPDEANIGRVIALRLGCGHRVPGWTVQRNCASGLQALDSAAKDIALGRADLVLAGGTEAMSHHPVLYRPEMVAWLGRFSRTRGVWGRLRELARLRPSHLKPVIGLLRGLTDPVVGLSMGQTAEVLAARFGIGRAEMDAFAVESHRRLGAAVDSGRMAPELVTLYHQGRIVDRDDGLRPDSSLENLAKLHPAFDRPHGSVTAGNSAQITDGAACMLLASADAVERHGLVARARVVDVAWAGLDPAQMGLGPAYAIERLLSRTGLEIPAIDYWEINEAFAAQVLACLRALVDPDFCRSELGRDKPMVPIDPERLNVDGGAISLGHPVGSSGARITWHLLRTLEARRAQRGVASLCIGGGQGGAVLLERTDAGVPGES
ncbi:3-ketoacyl-CoA thiolase; Acetyl-CoA acetyltransferase [Thioalkalivibrio nitratireducens DSM 14787]|uniref:3-ketoacyl-CoA thiolase Acetyl-CoA acetyltransferase n=1 Tax=Thioalkalivibrio nitratireducens (strain DSM 14787 / UNIQEM 213 / ALEN2) TaxID=1255043 RepID=L0DSX9_THIND|nr:acetyl-CoA C-acetyltransferase [Thioalkalivibrio nitratireducens]AGA32719.1 3-ketoacyl-CoA thiolase; Acetyl-CoA acetyltransferase [Thioalkalivibrio nitratireducens DSM 14787]